MRICFSLLILLFATLSFKAQIPTDSLVGYWPFTKNANDESKNGYHGINNGGTLSNDRSNNIDEAFYFDGINDKILISNHNGALTFGSGDQFSISLWMKISDYPDYYDFIFDHKNSTLNGIFILLTPDGHINVDFEGNTNNVNYGLSTVDSLIPNHWYNLITIYDGKNKKAFLYINNQVVDSVNIGIDLAGSLGDESKPLTFGYRSGLEEDTYFKGWLDDIIIYNKILDRTEIKQISTEKACSDIVIDDTSKYFVVNEDFTKVSPVVYFDSSSVLNTKFYNCDSIINYYSLFQFQPNYCNIPEEKNIALNQSYKASVMNYELYPARNPKNAFDGDTTTIWHPQAYPTQWISVYFKNFSKIDSLTMWYGQTPSGSTTQEIYSTSDSVNWNLVETYTPQHNLGQGNYTLRFSEKIEKSKGLKITTTQNPSWIQWREIEVWGQIEDTEMVFDTIWINDTVWHNDTNWISDTMWINDTIWVNDTNWIVDTTWINDTNSVTVYDTLKFDVSTGVLNIELSQIKVYPNPVNTYIFVSISNIENLRGSKISLTNTLGREFYSETVNNVLLEIPVSGLERGLYFLNLQKNDGETLFSKKIILQ